MPKYRDTLDTENDMSDPIYTPQAPDPSGSSEAPQYAFPGSDKTKPNLRNLRSN